MKPIFLIAGGRGHARKSPDPLLQAVFAQTGQVRPSIAYMGAASDDDRDFLKWIASLFREAGAGAVRLAPLADARADLEEARAVLAESDLVFVSGGDVEAGVRILRERKMMPFLRHLHAGGKPFFGLSAGSIMLAQRWVNWPDAQDESRVEPFDCMGFAPVLCDTHAEAEDWEELKALLQLGPCGATGYGIPSGGALRVASNGRVTAFGKPVPRFRFTEGAVQALPPVSPAAPPE